MTSRSITIAGREIGTAHAPYVIAELSANHNGDLSRALEIMTAAKQAGAHAIKLQTYTADTMTIDHPGEDFQISGGLWDGYSLYDLYAEAHTPWDWHGALFAHGAELGITVFSTPFDASAVAFLEDLNVPAYKIASFEVIDLPLIACVAATGKPMIISTGMADLDEITEAVATAHAAGAGEIALLHCVSGYPTPHEEANLHTLADLAVRFEDTVIGLSDHTHGIGVAVAGVALGAAIIEKHVTMKRSDGGHDAAFSLEPDELADLVTNCHMAWQAGGVVGYGRKSSEIGSMVFRRSLYVVADMKAGDAFDENNLRSIRPGFGLPPKHLPEVLGRKAKSDTARGTALDWSLVE